MENSPATGAPTISGTAQVGETLTADTSAIADEDGLTNAAFSYQWIRNDGSADTDIQDATTPTYTPVAADVGKTIKVQVSFTDDAGNGESLTSAQTAAVVVAPEPGLVLSDFDAGDGQEVLASALVSAGDRGRKNNESQDRAWYATDTLYWHASGELLEGALAWNGMTVNRVVYFPATGVFRFNDAEDGFNLGESFEAGGINRELTIWIQTESGTVSFQAKDHIVNHGGHWINFLVPEADRSTLDAIAEDDLIIVAVSVPADS